MDFKFATTIELQPIGMAGQLAVTSPQIRYLLIYCSYEKREQESKLLLKNTLI